ncbi:hypothetical protein [Lewinella sp. IMCC34191]|uniref:hypothetical protein n=1 Tax=Lewinella sp. IMCC34191 TaxID=2259172 RepID=UPI000E25BE56|nr:hypothetical protein [Lewinella sp. IMCC34191]
MNKHLNTRFFLASCRVGIQADVRLGSPRFSDCRGVGICAILLDGIPEGRGNCRDWCQANLVVDGPTGRLLLQFVRGTISERTYDHHFASGYLKVQEPYRLPIGVASRLGLTDTDLAITPGRYPALDTGDTLLVSCRLSAPAVRSMPLAAKAA